MVIKENYPLLGLNTFHMTVSTSWFAEYSNVAELQDLLKSDLLSKNEFFHIGGGSNLLFTKDFPGVILHSAIRFIEKRDENEESVYLRVGAGVVWDDFCRFAVENGYGGVENLSWIPGEVGASAVQNIGAYGVEAGDLIDSVETIEVLSGNPRVFKVDACGYGYRESVFKKELKGKYIVTAVVYRLDKTPHYKLDYGNLRHELAAFSDVSLETVRQAVIDIRKSKLPDPDVAGNAGSFFMNPVITRSQFEKLKQEYPAIPHYDVSEEMVKVPAAWMIDQCGWKGREHGGAAVHDKQCLVLINKCGATARDIQELAAMISESVWDKFKVYISPEVNYI